MDTYDPALFLDMKLALQKLIPKQKAVARRKKKTAAATCQYQADCDGEWSKIYIDFVNKKTKIIRLADWDLTRWQESS